MRILLLLLLGLQTDSQPKSAVTQRCFTLVRGTVSILAMTYDNSTTNVICGVSIVAIGKLSSRLSHKFCVFDDKLSHKLSVMPLHAVLLHEVRRVQCCCMHCAHCSAAARSVHIAVLLHAVCKLQCCCTHCYDSCLMFDYVCIINFCIIITIIIVLLHR